jgi:hypothetical protein
MAYHVTVMSWALGTDFRQIAVLLVHRLCRGPWQRLCRGLGFGLLWLPVSACNVSPDLSMSGQACEQRDCEKRGVYLSAPIAAPIAELPTLFLEVCKNGACVVSQMSPLPDGTGWSCDALGPIASRCRVTPSGPGPGGSPQLELHVTGRDGDFIDGDHFTITLGAQGAPPRLAVDKSVNPYETALPNGPLCPLRCRYAVLSI